MPYISAASTISHQPTFGNAGFSDSLRALESSSAIMSPNYKEYIDAGLLRRMSKILRMSVTCAKDALAQANLEQPDAIIVGTGLGCLQDTEKFLNTFLTVEGLLPPTSFIQSTHNTIAGQISLSIGNHGYNMTHTQNTLSFEHALQDSLMLLNEGSENVLAGGADEFIEILEEIREQLSIDDAVPASSGASFFVIGKENTGHALAEIVDVAGVGMYKDLVAEIDFFLAKNSLSIGDINLILYSGYVEPTMEGDLLQPYLDNGGFVGEVVTYAPISGLYATNSAFAMHYAIDRMQLYKGLNNVLIYNTLNKINLGLSLLKSIET